MTAAPSPAPTMRPVLLAPPSVVLDLLRANLDEVRSRARMHWRTCWAQRNGRPCQACTEWDADELAAERALKRAMREERVR